MSHHLDRTHGPKAPKVATPAGKTNTFLAIRYRRVVKRRGKLKALLAVAHSILIIIMHVLADPPARYHGLGANFHNDRVSVSNAGPAATSVQ